MFYQHININVAADVCKIFVDQMIFAESLRELMSNASIAMPAGGLLTVECYNEHGDSRSNNRDSVEAVQDYVVISVTDTGMGMTPETLRNAFDPLFSTYVISGAKGMGLSKVYGFINQANGFIEMSSSVGAGTTVKMRLPAFQY